MDDSEVIRQFMEGDPSSWGLVLQRYHALVWTVVSRKLEKANISEASDIVRDVFVIVFEKQAEFSPKYDDVAMSFRAWVCAIAVNKVLEFNRHRKPEVVSTELVSLHARYAEAEESMDADDDRDLPRDSQPILDANDCVNSLSKNGRKVLKVNIQAPRDATSTEKAALLKMTASAFRTALSRAKKEFAECLRRKKEARQSHD